MKRFAVAILFEVMEDSISKVGINLFLVMSINEKSAADFVLASVKNGFTPLQIITLEVPELEN